MDKNNDPTMGGLDALVAAASSVAGQAKKARARGGVPMNLIDPALQGDSSSGIPKDTADALSLFLSNPAVVQLIAEYNAKKQRRHVSLYTQLLSGSNMPAIPPDTPVQQTRSGRISRPPVYATANNPFQQLMGLGSTNGLHGHNTFGAGVGVTSDLQLQAIKDALENVSSQTETADPTAGSYDALMQAVDGDPASRFWRNTDAGPSSWTTLDAQTLAQAAEATQRGLGLGMPNGKANGLRKRGASAMDSTEDEELDSPDGKRARNEDDANLPAWPLPPSGKGGRKNMPREELLARRRARNRVAAQESRKKKKDFFGTIEERLKDREDAYAQLEEHCHELEREVEALKKVVLGAGLELPSEMPVTLNAIPSVGATHSVQTPDETPVAMTIDDPSTGFTLPFDDIFTIDDNDADDGDFVPPSSPKRDSESEDSDADDEEDPSTIASASAAGQRGKKGSKRRNSKKVEERNQIVEAEDEEEDLFLPIEDVPIPPPIFEEEENKVIKQAMDELHVDTPQELMGVIKKMVDTASYGGVTEEQVGMLSKLLALGQAQGMSVW